jgi:hypothetical protein
VSLDGDFRQFLGHFGTETDEFLGQKGRSPTPRTHRSPHVIKNDIISAAAEAADVERQKAAQAVETIIDALRQLAPAGLPRPLACRRLPSPSSPYRSRSAPPTAPRSYTTHAVA